MSEGLFFNWHLDQPSSLDVIQLDGYGSDLIHIPLSEAEVAEISYYDALAQHIISQDNHYTLPSSR